MKRSYSARAARVAAVAASNTTSAKSDIRLVDMTYLSLVLPRVFTCFRIGLQAPGLASHVVHFGICLTVCKQRMEVSLIHPTTQLIVFTRFFCN